jgi:organic hydroperoxide reductase OsmC/OhrA
MQPHRYEARLIWEGNTGSGTASYAGYSRDYRIITEGKPPIGGSADPAFHGDAARHNPEDLFVAAIAACHMLFYLGLCARSGVRVLYYDDNALGELSLRGAGGGRFECIVLRPHVTISADSDDGLARRLHDEAHARCFIANSCSVPIRHEPVIAVDGREPAYTNAVNGRADATGPAPGAQ